MMIWTFFYNSTFVCSQPPLHVSSTFFYHCHT